MIAVDLSGNYPLITANCFWDPALLRGDARHRKVGSGFLCPKAAHRRRWPPPRQKGLSRLGREKGPEGPEVQRLGECPAGIT